jgi:hypothetical protein
MLLSAVFHAKFSIILFNLKKNNLYRVFELALCYDEKGS